jgi:hypothetical protein
MIELNTQQRQAIAQGQPVRIVDLETQDAYVVLRRGEAVGRTGRNSSVGTVRG